MEILAEKEILAVLENLHQLMEMVTTCAEKQGINQKQMFNIELALEEVFVNIFKYAYKDQTGSLKVVCGLDDANHFVMEISDSGIPYNILLRDDPSIVEDIADRKIGGLGIFLIKKLMDEVSYRYEDNKNILTLVIYPEL